PVFGMIIKPEQFNDLLAAMREKVGEHFLVAKKPDGDRLKVTFVITAENPPTHAELSQTLGKLADNFQAGFYRASAISPTEISFPGT
ncbi:MAG TPA: hypothetical protein V6D23_01695, partial [Candidatus Obscuribacterales bacterium]